MKKGRGGVQQALHVLKKERAGGKTFHYHHRYHRANKLVGEVKFGVCIIRLRKSRFLPQQTLFHVLLLIQVSVWVSGYRHQSSPIHLYAKKGNEGQVGEVERYGICD
jgi:hypothetical protein